MQRGRVYFSIGEEAIIAALVEQYGITELEAIGEVIKQKKELAFLHKERGNLELAQQIIKELGEDI